MEEWEKTPYRKWYASHRRFSFTAHHMMEIYEDGKQIPNSIFKPFLKSLSCHSKSEEKMFHNVTSIQEIFEEHSKIVLLKQYSNEEKYTFCKELLQHMKKEETTIFNYITKKIE